MTIFIAVIVGAYGFIKFEKMYGRLDTTFQESADNLIVNSDSENFLNRTLGDIGFNI